MWHEDDVKKLENNRKDAERNRERTGRGAEINTKCESRVNTRTAPGIEAAEMHKKTHIPEETTKPTETQMKAKPTPTKISITS